MSSMRKGQGMSINTIVLAVLALVVLVLLIFLVRNQLQKGSQKYLNISGEAETQARSKDICETMFALRSRTCLASCDPTKYNDLGTNWQDCKTKGGHCCEAS